MAEMQYLGDRVSELEKNMPSVSDTISEGSTDVPTSGAVYANMLKEYTGALTFSSISSENAGSPSVARCSYSNSDKCYKLEVDSVRISSMFTISVKFDRINELVDKHIIVIPRSAILYETIANPKFSTFTNDSITCYHSTYYNKLVVGINGITLNASAISAPRLSVTFNILYI